VFVAKKLDVRKWAVVGAGQRLLEITEERLAIYRAFPELGRGRRGAPAGTAETEGQPPARRARRRRRKISAEARKRISEVQKARWAKWRKANAKG
jgi:hypothetical protein